MRSAPLLVSATLLLSACSPVRVTTTVAPDAQFASYRTFRVLNVPARRAGLPTVTNDPMFVSSVSSHALREDLTNAFDRLGYVVDQANPDFTVAYYASRRGELDVTAWDYGYRGRWGGWRGDPGLVQVRPFVEGTVIVDVVNPKTHELVWRGRGVSDVSDDPETYGQNLERTVKDIVKRFPAR